MNKRQQLRNSLQDKQYRQEFAADVFTGLAFQIRLLREKVGWTQEEMAQRMGKHQETISQWENPNYGRFTLKTLGELAAAFDVGLIVKFAPFNELLDWIEGLTPQRLAPLSFEEEERLPEGSPLETLSPVDTGAFVVVNGASIPELAQTDKSSAEHSQGAKVIDLVPILAQRQSRDHISVYANTGQG